MMSQLMTSQLMTSQLMTSQLMTSQLMTSQSMTSQPFQREKRLALLEQERIWKTQRKLYLIVITLVKCLSSLMSAFEMFTYYTHPATQHQHPLHHHPHHHPTPTPPPPPPPPTSFFYHIWKNCKIGLKEKCGVRPSPPGPRHCIAFYTPFLRFFRRSPISRWRLCT